jgi:hypothetical protein
MLLLANVGKQIVQDFGAASNSMMFVSALVTNLSTVLTVTKDTHNTKRTRTMDTVHMQRQVL